MSIPIGKSFQCTATGSTIRRTRCEACGKEFSYPVECSAKGGGFSLLFLDDVGAAARARERAETRLRKALQESVGLAPCPACGWYQSAMVRQARRSAVWPLSLAVLFLGVVAVFFVFSMRPETDPAWMGSGIGLALLGSAVTGGLVWWLKNPNRARRSGDCAVLPAADHPGLDHGGGQGLGEVQQASMDQQLFRVLKRVMIFLMLADEAVDEAEVETIQGIYKQFTGQDLARDEIDREIELVRSAGANALEEAIVFSDHLTDEGKELLLRAAIIVVGADGVCGPEERERLVELACSLGILPEAFNRVWSSMLEVREPES